MIFNEEEVCSILTAIEHRLRYYKKFTPEHEVIPRLLKIKQKIRNLQGGDPMIHATLTNAPNIRVFHVPLSEYPTIQINDTDFKPFSVTGHSDGQMYLDYMDAQHNVITLRHRKHQNEPVTENLFKHIEGFYPLHFIDFRRLQEPINIQLQTKPKEEAK